MGKPAGDELIVEEVDLEGVDGELDEIARRLWRKAMKAGTWDPADLDFSEDREQYRGMEPAARAYLERFCAAFYQAEENVATIFGPWVMAAPSDGQQAFLSTQMVDEHKHTEVFARFFDEVVGHPPGAALANPVHDTVAARGEKLLATRADPSSGDARVAWVEAVTHYMGIIEGVQANTGYQIYRSLFASRGLLPGLTAGFANIQHDEGRHVGFGMQVLRRHAAEDAALASRIRDMFEEYLPLIRVRYGRRFVDDVGVEHPPPDGERGEERLMALYDRRLRDIFAERGEPR